MLTRLQTVLASASPWTAEAFLNDLVQRCQTQMPPDLPLAPVSQGDAALVLAALVVERAATRGRHLGAESAAALTTKIARETTRLALVVLAAEAAGQWTADLTGTPGAFAAAAAVVEEFRQAIAPGQLTAVFYGSMSGRERFTTFLQTRQTAQGEVQARVREWLRQAGLQPDEVDRLLGRLTRPTLATYSQDQFAAMAAAFRTWDPLLRYLTGDPALRQSDALAAQVSELLRQLQAHVAARWRDSDPADVDDAVGDALQAALDGASTPGSGYRYEGSLPGWLLRVARRAMQARHQVESWEEGESELEAAQALRGPASLAVRQRVAFYDEWYPLVELTFKANRRPQVKAIWASLRLSLGDAERGGPAPVSDEVLARALARLGPPLAADTVAGLRRRLRQRLSAVRWTYEDVPGGAPDGLGDSDMLACIRKQYGAAQGDWPTLRGMTSYARATQRQAQANAPLAIYSKMVVDPSCRPPGIAWLTASPPPPPGADEPTPFERGRRWTDTPGNLQRLGRLRNKARLAGVSFAVGPCWQLVVALGIDPGKVANILHVAPPEREAIESLAYELGGHHR